MVGSMLKKTAVAAAVMVAVVGTAGAATAQASPTWTTTGDFAGEGQVTFQTAGFVSFTCSVAISGTAENVAGAARSTIDEFTTSGCTTPLSCSISVTPNSPSSWTMTESGSAAPFRVTLGSVSLGLQYGGASCPLNGVQMSVTGAVGSDFVSPADGNGAVLEFSNATGLSTPFGNGVLNGWIELFPTAGGELDLS